MSEANGMPESFKTKVKVLRYYSKNNTTVAVLNSLYRKCIAYAEKNRKYQKNSTVTNVISQHR